MSTNQKGFIEKKNTESPHVFNYLREEIPIEDIEDYASPKRLESIDFVKGFAIIFIMLAHIGAEWLNNQWLFLVGIVFAWLDILGPSLFTFLSALSVIFSIKRKEKRLPQKIIRNRIFSRGLTLILIGAIFNALVNFNTYIFPFSLWGWNILFFIGFSQIFSYYSLKMSKMTRIILGLIIIFYSPALVELFYQGKDTNILFWILDFIATSPVAQMPVLPWISISFISTIFGEYLYEAMEKDTRDAFIGLVRLFLFWGITLLISGIIFGFRLHTLDTINSDLYPHIFLLETANSQNIIPTFNFPGMPEFLIRNMSSQMLYNLGAALMIISVSLYLIDINERKGKFVRMMIFYGKISLSLFMMHFGFIFIYARFLPVWYFAVAYFGFVGLLGFMMYIWNHFAGGVGSPEWLMIQMGRIGEKTGDGIKKTSEKAYEKAKKGIKSIEKELS
ncbi:MAG: hypothetical protein GF317_02570 [Candidatus Lokiarchaeota archaeon]|nr:hypothetical protein [Candidatus Lokiarchaeota archaeon]MBD3198790.1 hypothetical protein [Candidatus Lokiarchaeota archaeon]